MAMSKRVESMPLPHTPNGNMKSLDVTSSHVDLTHLILKYGPKKKREKLLKEMTEKDELQTKDSQKKKLEKEGFAIQFRLSKAYRALEKQELEASKPNIAPWKGKKRRKKNKEVEVVDADHNIMVSRLHFSADSSSPRSDASPTRGSRREPDSARCPAGESLDRGRSRATSPSRRIRQASPTRRTTKTTSPHRDESSKKSTCQSSVGHWWRKFIRKKSPKREESSKDTDENFFITAPKPNRNSASPGGCHAVEEWQRRNSARKQSRLERTKKIKAAPIPKRPPSTKALGKCPKLLKEQSKYAPHKSTADRILTIRDLIESKMDKSASVVSSENVTKSDISRLSPKADAEPRNGEYVGAFHPRCSSANGAYHITSSQHTRSAASVSSGNNINRNELSNMVKPSTAVTGCESQKSRSRRLSWGSLRFGSQTGSREGVSDRATSRAGSAVSTRDGATQRRPKAVSKKVGAKEKEEEIVEAEEDDDDEEDEKSSSSVASIYQLGTRIEGSGETTRSSPNSQRTLREGSSDDGERASTLSSICASTVHLPGQILGKPKANIDSTLKANRGLDVVQGAKPRHCRTLNLDLSDTSETSRCSKERRKTRSAAVHSTRATTADGGEEKVGPRYRTPRYLYTMCNCQRVGRPGTIDTLQKKRKTVGVIQIHGCSGQTTQTVCPFCKVFPSQRIEAWKKNVDPPQGQQELIFASRSRQS